jgi:protein gp37
MASKTAIEWTSRRHQDGTITPGATWTPIRARVREDAAEIARSNGYTSLVQIAEKMAGKVGVHCEGVSEECRFCYAEANNRRCLPANGTGLPFDHRSRELVDIFVDDSILEQPLHWRKPRDIFVCSQTDLFAPFVKDAYIERVFGAMRLAAHHRFLVLTKRPERALAWFQKYAGRNHCHEVFDIGTGRVRSASWIDPLENVWFGVTAGSPDCDHGRVTELRKIPAVRRFVSVEPLLGPVDFDVAGLDWIIVGGESGRRARPMHPRWVQDIRDRCIAAGVPFFFKQWGKWAPCDYHGDIKHHTSCRMISRRGLDVTHDMGQWGSAAVMMPVGKKAAGRLLDGREWNEKPSS